MRNIVKIISITFKFIKIDISGKNIEKEKNLQENRSVFPKSPSKTQLLNSFNIFP